MDVADAIFSYAVSRERSKSALQFLTVALKSNEDNVPQNAPLSVSWEPTFLLQTPTFQPLTMRNALEAAQDFDMHSHHLLEEALALQSSQSQQQQQAIGEKRSIPAPSSLSNARQPSIRIPDVDDHVPKKLKSDKEKFSFSTAKDVYIDQGGVISKNNSSSNGRPSSSGGITSAATKKSTTDNPNYDKALVERIEADIIEKGKPVRFDDIAGLEFVKQTVIELICWPISQPSLFQGLRTLPRGILLFGPPGTGKTLVGKAIATQAGATFFSISASSLMSKWIGEGEKTVRTLFAVAVERQPSVVFIDEIDSLLCQRSSDENEATRRMKTEFMVQLDGANTNQDARVVVIGATNRPEELDEAVRRRFVKRLYVPLPEDISRRQLFENLLCKVEHVLTSPDLDTLTLETNGFSGADIQALCQEAAMGPLREVARHYRGNLGQIVPQDLPPVTMDHFRAAMGVVLASVSPNDLKRYRDWNAQFGSYHRHESGNS